MLKKQVSGFTLIELLVVLALMSILLAVTVPRFRAVFSLDPLKQASRQVIGAVREARQRAGVSEKGCFLEVEIDSRRLSLLCLRTPELGEQGEDKKEEEPVAELLVELPEEVSIESVWDASYQRLSTGIASLWINSRGLMEPSIINLGDGSDTIGLEISPFLTDIRLADEALTPAETDPGGT